MLQCFKIRVIRVVYLSPRITLISRMLLCLSIRVIRAIRVVYLFTTNFSNLTNAAVFIIRVIRAIRVVFLPLPLNRYYSVLFEIGVAA